MGHPAEGNWSGVGGDRRRQLWSLGSACLCAGSVGCAPGPGSPPCSLCEHKAPRPRAMGQSMQALNPLHENCSFVPRTRDDPGAPHVGGEGCVSGEILKLRTAGIRVVKGSLGARTRSGGLAAPRCKEQTGCRRPHQGSGPASSLALGTRPRAPGALYPQGPDPFLAHTPGPGPVLLDPALSTLPTQTSFPDAPPA